MNPMEIKCSLEDIEYKRSLISRLFMEQSKNILTADIKSITPADVETLFKLYDKVFFNNWFSDSYKGKLRFEVSGRMTKSAGLTVCPKNIMKMKPEDVAIEIKISRDIILGCGSMEESRVAGIKTKNSLEALQLVLEHEICHVIEFITFGRSSCRGKRFKAMAGSIFGHTESTHTLPTASRVAYESLGIMPGCEVCFNYEGNMLKGVVSNVNKRATVMVRDKKGIYYDTKGRRYTKFYVPLGRLTRV